MADVTTKLLHMTWGTMACVERGTGGVPLIFLHGTGCDSGDFDGVLAGLPARQRALRLDFRAHGGSSAPTTNFTMADLAEDVLEAMRQLKIGRGVLVGHSLGGMVAIEAAGRSGSVAGLVLLEGWTSLKAAGAFGKGRFYGALPPPRVAEIQRKYAAMRERVAPGIWTPFWESVKAFDGHAILSQAAIPIMEMYGAMGAEPGTQERLLVPSNPMIAWRWIAGAGHYLPQEASEDVARICVECLSEWEKS